MKIFAIIYSMMIGGGVTAETVATENRKRKIRQDDEEFT
jgi:hypothetical protein